MARVVPSERFRRELDELLAGIDGDTEPVELERSRVRNARELGFESRILGKHVARTHALESLVICSFLRGLSVRDVEAALEETFDEPVIGKSTVARVCKDTAAR